MTNNPFILSIETNKGTFQWSFHLGTDPRIAREMAEERFHNPPEHLKGMGATCVVTVALMLDGRIFDIYDGEWSSQKDYFPEDGSWAAEGGE